MLRTRRRLNFGKLRRVGIVTVDAIVALPGTAIQIPIAVHAAMRTMLIVAKVGPMTLRTQGHHLGELHRSTIRQVQVAIALARIMASYTSLPAVVQLQSLMKLVEVRCRSSLAIGRTRGVAMLARYGDGVACLIAQAGIDRGRTLRCADMHRMVCGCDRYWFDFGCWRCGMIRLDLGTTARCSQEHDPLPEPPLQRHAACPAVYLLELRKLHVADWIRDDLMALQWENPGTPVSCSLIRCQNNQFVKRRTRECQRQ